MAKVTLWTVHPWTIYHNESLKPFVAVSAVNIAETATNGRVKASHAVISDELFEGIRPALCPVSKSLRLCGGC